jgi:hypothetical protein
MKPSSALISPAVAALASALLWAACTATLLATPTPALAWWGSSNSTTGSGNVATEQRAVADFEAISLSSSIKLEVRQTGREALTISGDDNILPLIETVVESGTRGKTLVIRGKRGESWRSKSEIKVVVEVARLTGLAISGSGDALVAGALKTPKLDLSIAGSGDARIEALAADEFGVRIAGSGDVRALGSARAVKVSIAGSGDAVLAGLTAEDVTVSIAGSGDAQVSASKSLSASIAGSGDVRYSGNPANVKSSVMGSGSVVKR